MNKILDFLKSIFTVIFSIFTETFKFFATKETGIFIAFCFIGCAIIVTNSSVIDTNALLKFLLVIVAVGFMTIFYKFKEKSI